MLGHVRGKFQAAIGAIVFIRIRLVSAGTDAPGRRRPAAAGKMKERAIEIGEEGPDREKKDARGDDSPDPKEQLGRE